MNRCKITFFVFFRIVYNYTQFQPDNMGDGLFRKNNDSIRRMLIGNASMYKLRHLEWKQYHIR